MEHTHTARRYFVRCLDCLAVVAIDVVAVPAAMTCGACGGTVENMGRVQGKRVVFDDRACPCDTRCTSATGPNCDCSCRGKNHGSGVVVDVTIDAGPVPVVQIPTAARAIERATEWRAARDGVRAQLRPLAAQRAAGDYLHPVDYRRMTALQDTLQRARKARSHAGRMRILAGA